MKEVWKRTRRKGYEVSNLGHVRSKNRTIWMTSSRPGWPIHYKQKRKGRLLKASFGGGNYPDDGYLHIQLGRNCQAWVHQLVAEAFVPNPMNLPEVNHKDGNKANNRADNLEWKNHRGNYRHGKKKGLHRKNRKTGRFVKAKQPEGRVIVYFAGGSPIPETSIKKPSLMMSHFVDVKNGKPCSRLEKLLDLRRKAKKRRKK